MIQLSSVKQPPTMGEAETLIQMLAFRAAHTPDREAVIFRGENGEEVMTFSALWERLNRVAHFLAGGGIEPGDRVIVVLPNGLEFFPVFYGVQRAGAIVVPLFPGSGVKRILKIIQLSGAKAVIAPTETPESDLVMFRQVGEGMGFAVHTAAECIAAEGADESPLPEAEPEDVAFIQYTSGSTGNSKGVQLSHRNLISNLRQMIAASLMTDEDVIVTWLPVYHDLGLILMTMCPLYLAAKLVLLPTTLTNLGAWLEAIMAHRGTYTAAPDVAYRLCLKQARNPGQYDLSSLRIAIDAAEPVRAATVEAFEKHFGLKGVIKPAYGLAEASVGVAFWGVEPTPIKVDERGFVSVGRAIPDIDLKIVDGDRELPRGEIGELVFTSPSSTRGYYHNPEATAALFWRDGYVRTGDMAYIDADGDLFIVARMKNMIKSSGRSIAPSEVEEIVDQVSKVRYSAAVGVDRGGSVGEQAYVFAEVRMNETAAEEDGPVLVREIVQNVYERLGFRPGRVYLVKPHTIPFTYNGKIKHVELRDSYQSGKLAQDNMLVYPQY